MAKLVGVAHDVHGLDLALDDVDGQHAPDPDLSLLLASGQTGSAVGCVSGVLYQTRCWPRVDEIDARTGHVAANLGGPIKRRGHDIRPARPPVAVARLDVRTPELP